MKHIKNIFKWKLCFLILSGTIFTSTNSFAQNNLSTGKMATNNPANNINHQPFPCGSYTIDANALQAAKNFEANPSNNLVATTFTIRVFFHVCFDDNGTNRSITDAQIKTELNTLIADFAPNNICFIKMGVDYIYSTAINEMTTLNASLLIPNNIPNCINIYYQNQLPSGVGGNAYSIPNTYLSIASGNIGLGQTISHEVGHCLGLLHTFEPSTGYENINGSNSSSAGDQITDTPADPFAYKGQGCFSTSTCCYTGSCTDPNGQSNFNPPYTNLMAYWWSYGWVNLVKTAGQYTRVNSYLSTNSTLQACESSNSITLGPVSYNSGYHMISALNTLITSGSVILNGTTATTLGGALVDIQPGFIATATGGALILLEPSLCSPVPRFGHPGDLTSTNNLLKGIVCYPNPFNSSTTISYSLDKSSTVELRVYNSQMQLVRTIYSNQWQDAGNYSVKFDGSDLQSGIYFVKLNDGEINAFSKMVLTK